MKRLNKPSEIPDLPRADEAQRNAVENTKKKRDTNMRNAMIRISAVNITTKDYPQAWSKKRRYSYIYFGRYNQNL